MIRFPVPAAGLLLLLLLPVRADAQDALQEALTFLASFDQQIDAIYARGDPVLYTAPSWDARAQATPGLPGGNLAAWAEDEGRFGDALWINNYEDAFLFFNAEQNLAYRETHWSGTISFWLRLNPDEDLQPGAWSDPIQITPRSWDDAALFVDFTRHDVPRRFRLAAFADTEIWNPSGENWQDLPDGAMPMIAIDDPPFGRERWTHVVMTFEAFNTGQPDGVVKAYLNGVLVGALRDREQTFTWDPAQALVKIGLQYVGYLDELAFFNRALSDADIQRLYALPGGLAGLLR